MENKERLIIFVKLPEKGKVKSRLAAVLDDGVIAELYRFFVEDLLTTIRQTGRRACIAFYPADAADKITAWLGADYDYMPQQGSDIGERMQNAFLAAFSQGMERVVLIGSDFPDLPSEIIEEAFLSLGNNDAVIGPARDGGYYLIGLRDEKFPADIFRDIPWSTEQVFDRTVSIFNANGYRSQKLRNWSDIDLPEDLRNLITRNKETGFMQSKTMKLLLSGRISTECI